MPRTIALVACVSQKAGVPLPARQLYTSDWFRKASAYAARRADAWYVLSARYGLLPPERVVAPYNETLKQQSAPARRAWAAQVLHDLCALLQPGDRVLILAGTSYREHLVGRIQALGCTVEVPMRGLAIGQQLHWLKEQLT